MGSLYHARDVVGVTCLFATVAFPAAAVVFRRRTVAWALGLLLISLPISALVLASFPTANQVAKQDALYPEPHVDPYHRAQLTPLFLGVAQLLVGYVLFHRRRTQRRGVR